MSDRDPLPSMGAEDFACSARNEAGRLYLDRQRRRRRIGPSVHNPHYDFNDEILALGASYWARLAETVLEK